MIGPEFQFYKMEKLWRVTAQQWEQTQHYCTVYLQMVKMANLILRVFYHNKINKINLQNNKQQKKTLNWTNKMICNKDKLQSYWFNGINHM